MGAQSARLDRIAYWERDMYSLLWHNTTEQHTHTPLLYIYIRRLCLSMQTIVSFVKWTKHSRMGNIHTVTYPALRFGTRDHTWRCDILHDQNRASMLWLPFLCCWWWWWCKKKNPNTQQTVKVDRFN